MCARMELCEHYLKSPGSQGHRRRAAVRCFMEASITLIFAAVTPWCNVHAYCIVIRALLQVAVGVSDRKISGTIE